MSDFGTGCIRALMAQGLDTMDIAQRIGCSEAQIWNLLVRESVPARLTVRLAPRHGAVSLPTAPGASASGGFLPVVVRNTGGEAQLVDQVNDAGFPPRGKAGVVHRGFSGASEINPRP